MSDEDLATLAQAYHGRFAVEMCRGKHSKQYQGLLLRCGGGMGQKAVFREKRCVFDQLLWKWLHKKTSTENIHSTIHQSMNE